MAVFNNHEHVIYSCGFKLVKTKHYGECNVCFEETKWTIDSDDDERFCSDECLEQDLRENMGNLNFKELDK